MNTPGRKGPRCPALMPAMPVVMGGVLIQDRAQVPRPGDQHPVGDLSPDSADPPLGKGVRSRAARRDLHHLDTGSRQHRVERLGELARPVPDHEPEASGPLPQAH
jgi:hypothetical protein